MGLLKLKLDLDPRYTVDRQAQESWDSIHENYGCCGPDGIIAVRYVEALNGSVPDSCCKDYRVVPQNIDRKHISRRR